MIKEDYVSFETAKLLKEKGFDEPCHAYWHEYENRLIISHSMYEIQNITNPCFFGPAAPTLQMAMKWLRDVHKKVINVEYIDFLEHGEVWSYSVLDRNTFHEFTEKSESFTEHSYEEACEEAIKYCLENLI